MDAFIKPDAESVSKYLEMDYISKYYGSFDGYSFCKDSYKLVIEPAEESRPNWLSIVDNLVTIKANTALDPEDDITITVKA